MTTYAIGDLQGCYSKLLELLERIHVASPNPRLIFAGDIVNRGPNSLDTLRCIQKMGDRVNVVLGNHDLHLLAVAQGLRDMHPTDTLNDILHAPDRDDLLDWLRRRPLAILEQNHLFVHAGVLPQWTPKKTLELAREVESALQGPDWVDFLRQMYGNLPARWEETLEGIDRLRCIVNALTRIRFCTTDGTMDLSNSKGYETALPGYLPWFDVSERETKDVTVVFGHWSTRGLTVRPNLIGLDTGCLWGGKLSAVCVENHSVIQVECPQYQRAGTVN